MDSMQRLLLLTLWCTASAVVSVGEYNVSIITDPRQGPFRIGQGVQFSCQVEPTPSGTVRYHWRNVDNVYGSFYENQQNYTHYYDYYDPPLPYCYYFCEVSVNGTLIGSARRIVQVQGFVYTEEPVVHSFTRGGNLVLNVNISDEYYTRYIDSLAWYHNGTEIVSGNKYTISNNDTMLMISNMVGSDAGTYEVKIRSISYRSYHNSPVCDSIMELSTVLHPVTFTVQESHPPSYDPSSIISIAYISDNIRLNGTVRYNLPLPITRTHHYWFRNGSRLSDGDMYNSTGSLQEGLSLQIMYNNTADVTGDYVGILWSEIDYISGLGSLCEGYYYFLTDLAGPFFFYRPFQITLTLSLWDIYDLPSSVVIHFEPPILTGLETTTVRCTAVGGGPLEAFTLWRNEELIARGNGRSLSHVTTPYQYGTYTCGVGSLRNTSVLMERAPFQLLLSDASTPLCDHQQSPPYDDLRTAVADLLRSVCGSCDDIDIVDVELNCSAAGTNAHLTAGLVYSSPDGSITASTLINRLLDWLLSEDTPSITVDGTPVALSKQCHTQLDNVTRNGCVGLTIPASTPDSKTTTTSSTPYMVGFFAGVVAGMFLMAAIIALIICVVKSRAQAAQPTESQEIGKPADIPMDTNQAYETVDARYQAGGLGRMPEEEERIYELPAAV